MLKNPLVRLAVLAFMLLGSALAFYLISPLFVRATFGYDGWPTLGYMPTRTPQPIIVNQIPTQTETKLPAVTDSSFSTLSTQSAISDGGVSILLEGESVLLLASGEFYSVAHSGRGTVTLYQDKDLGLMLRLEDFEVEDGPDLHLYLTSQETVEDTSGVDLEDGYDLGGLMGLSGNQNYELPADLDISIYKSVVIWCFPYQVSFIAAPLQSP